MRIGPRQAYEAVKHQRARKLFSCCFLLPILFAGACDSSDEKEPKLKTVQTPHGTVQYKEQSTGRKSFNDNVRELTAEERQRLQEYLAGVEPFVAQHEGEPVIVPWRSLGGGAPRTHD
jgi:hypothetical protein